MTYSRMKEKPEAAQHFLLCVLLLCVVPYANRISLRSWTVGVVDGSGSGRGVNGGGLGGLSRQSSGIVRVLFSQDSATR